MTRAEKTRNSAEESSLRDSSSHAMFKLDEEGRIDAWSDAAKSIYGYDAATITDQHLTDLIAETKNPKQTLSTVLSEAQSGAKEIERWNKRADDSFFWATMILSPLVDGLDGYVVVAKDTTTNKQYEQTLEHENDRLKKYTDVLSHDLRNPVNLIETRLELYRQTGDNEHLHQIEETTARMKRLIDDLLQMAKQGEAITDPDPIDLERVIETAWGSTGNTIDTATIHYQEVPSIVGDYDRLCELFENLFRNCIDHAGPDVTVRIGPIDGGFYVEDDGPGIDAEYVERVFDHGFTTNESGNGYGLSMVRTIVEAHGWEIEATKSKAGGARFEITGIKRRT